jgi:flavin-dependent thymidylate synthase
MTSSEIQKYIDPAMYDAEPMSKAAREKPQVHLLWMTPDPLGVAAAMSNMYASRESSNPVIRSLSEVTHADRELVLDDMKKTALTTPFESIVLHFMIEGVTRAFTHQLVRTRMGAYVQESMRFAVKEEGIPVSLPPSLTDPEAMKHYDAETQESMQEEWGLAVQNIDDAYHKLIDLGMPAEDARGLLPTNIQTRIHFKIDLRNLVPLAGLRLCTQAQFEWRQVWIGIVTAIRDYNPYASLIRQAANMSDDDAMAFIDHCAASDSWQYEAIAGLFRPICYNTGKCEFKASPDRSCTIRNRVDANAKLGRPSDKWHLPFNVVAPGMPSPAEHVAIEGIHSSEWLSDPTAAR